MRFAFSHKLFPKDNDEFSFFFLFPVSFSCIPIQSALEGGR